MLPRVDNHDGAGLAPGAGPEALPGLGLAAAMVRTGWGDMVNGRVAPAGSPEDLAERLDAISLEAGIGLDAALEEAGTLMRSGDLLSAHARCFGFFNPTPAWPGVLADLLVAARNPQLAVVSHAPASVGMERRLMRWLLDRLDFPATASGHFTSGGSEANGTALQVALARGWPDHARLGLSALGGPARIYASADSHLAWIKLARAAGLGSDAVNLVDTDGQGRLSMSALEAAIHQDRAKGCVPVMIAATAGTTNAGMVDPLEACVALARAEGLHCHVDAAWAGALMVDRPLCRRVLPGLERADTVTVDAHKWLAAPMGAGMVFVRDGAALGRAFGVTTGYMPVGDGVDAYVTSNQWSRRFIGLRLWMVLRALGPGVYANLFARHFALADQLRDGLRAAGWEIRNPTSLPVVLFADPQGRDAAAMADWLAADGQVWLGHVRFEGESVLRACLTSHLTTSGDIDILLDRLEAARAAVQPAASR